MDKLVKWLENLLRAQKKSRAWRTFVSCLAAIVVFTTTYSLILPAITVEQSATEDVGGLVLDEADPGSTGAEAEAPGEVVTVDADNETTGETSDENPDEVAQEEAPAADEVAAQTAPTEETASENKTTQSAASQTETAQTSESKAAVAEEVREPVNGEVQTIGDKRVMTLTGEDFDVIVSGDLSVGVSDRTVLSVRGIPDAEVVKSFSDRISDELLKIFVDKKTTEVLYQLVFTDENLVEYTPAGYFDVQFIFHNNTVSHTGEKIYAAIYDYLTDEMVLAEKNGDEYETPVISLDEYGIIKGITLKGMHFDEYSDIITLVAGPVNEELKLAAKKAAEAAASENKTENTESADSKTESTGKTDSAEKAESTEKTGSSEKTESTDAKTDSAESKAEGPSTKAETSKGSEAAESGTLTARGTDYTVTLSYGADAKIPAGASLEVSEIENGTRAYKKYLAQAKAAMGLDKDQELPKEQARFFDIKIMADGKEVQPSANVSVNITYDQPVVEAASNVEPQVDASAVHFGKKGAEVVAVNDVDASRVEFEAESFSVYGVIYTVDFEYTDPTTGDTYYFSLKGNDSINLTELLVLLGIKTEENVEEFVANKVESVEFSNPELVSVTHNGKFLGLFGKDDWKITSLQPFTTEETLTISLKDGNKISIVVRDLQYTNSLNDVMTDMTISGAEWDAATNSYIVKNGKSYNISMTFQEGEGNGQYQFSNDGEMTLTLPTGITFETGTTFNIYVNEAGENYTISGNTVRIDENGNVAVKLNNRDPNYQKLKDLTTARFTISATGVFSNQSNQYVIDGQTDVNIKVDDTPDVNITKSGSVIEWNKDQTTAKVKYRLEVKSNGIASGVDISDTITGTGLTYDQGSAKVTVDGQNVSDWTTVSQSNTGFSMKTGTLQDGKTYVVEYTATITKNDLVDNGNGSYSLGASNEVNWTGNKKTTHDLGHVVTKPGISKSGSTKEQNGSVTTTTWKIEADSDYGPNNQLKNVTDTIKTDGVQYVGDGIHYVVTDKDTNAVIGEDDIPWNVVKAADGKSWTYDVRNFKDKNGQPIANDGKKYHYVITYDTQYDIGSATQGVIIKNDYEDNRNNEGEGQAYVNPNPENRFGLDKQFKSKETNADQNTIVTWTIKVTVPASGVSAADATLTDVLPSTGDYQDTFVSFERATGLYTASNESVDVDSTSEPGKVIFTFKTGENAGLVASTDGMARDIVLTLKTKCDPRWLADENAELTHTNEAIFHNEHRTAHYTPDKPSIKKDGWRDGEVEGLPKFSYSVTAGVFSDDLFTNPYPGTVTDSDENGQYIVIEDTFDERLAFVDGSATVGGGDQDSQENGRSSNGVTATVSGNKITFKLYKNTLPKNTGNLYQYYKINYSLKVKDQETLTALRDEAIAQGKAVELKNTVTGFGGNETTVKYEPRILDKGHQTKDGKLEFTIKVNEEGLKLSDNGVLVLTDSMTNLSVRYQDVKVEVAGNKTAETTDADGNPVTAPYFNMKGNDITFYIPDEAAVTITYLATPRGEVGADGKIHYSNTAKIKGFEKTDSGDEEYKSEASGYGTNYAVYIYKADGNVNSNALAGAEFKLYEVDEMDAEGNILSGTPVKNSDGSDYTVTTSDGKDGSQKGVVRVMGTEDLGWNLKPEKRYYLLETKAPEGYALDNTKYTFIISKDGYVNYTSKPVVAPDGSGKLVQAWTYHNGDVLTMKDWRKDGVLVLEKGFENIDPSKMDDDQKAAIKFKIYTINDDNTETLWRTITYDQFSAETNEDQTVSYRYTIGDLPEGKYKVVETIDDVTCTNTTYAIVDPDQGAAPHNESGNKNERYATIVISDEDVRDHTENHVTVTNTYDEPSEFKIYKHAKGETSYKLANAEFGVFEVDVNNQIIEPAIANYKTNARGRFSILQTAEDGQVALQPDTVYALKETKAPKGFLENEQVIYFCFLSEGQENLPANAPQDTKKISWKTSVGQNIEDTPDTTYLEAKKVYLTELLVENEEIATPVQVKVKQIASYDKEGTVIENELSGYYKIGAARPVKEAQQGSNFTIVKDDVTKKWHLESDEVNVVDGKLIGLPTMTFDNHIPIYYHYEIEEINPGNYIPSYAYDTNEEDGGTAATVTNKPNNTVPTTRVKAKKKWVDVSGNDITSKMGIDDGISVDVWRYPGELTRGTIYEADGSVRDAGQLYSIVFDDGQNGAEKKSILCLPGDRIRYKIKAFGFNNNKTIDTVPVSVRCNQTEALGTVTKTIDTANNEIVFEFTAPTDNGNRAIRMEIQEINSYELSSENITAEGRTQVLTQADLAAIDNKTKVETLELNAANGWSSVSKEYVKSTNSTTYTYFIVEPDGGNYGAEYRIEGDTITAVNVDKTLEVDKKWLASNGDEITTNKEDGQITYTISRNKYTITPPAQSNIDYSQLKAGGHNVQAESIASNIKIGSTIKITVLIKDRTPTPENSSLDNMEIIGGDVISSTKAYRVNTYNPNQYDWMRDYFVMVTDSVVKLSGNLVTTPDFGNQAKLRVSIQKEPDAVVTPPEGAQPVGEPKVVGTVTVSHDSIVSYSLAEAYKDAKVESGTEAWSAIIKKLPAFDAQGNIYSYSIQEAEGDYFEQVQIDEEGQITVVKGPVSATLGDKAELVNRLKPGSLTVKKAVAGADPKKTYEIAVTDNEGNYYGADGKNYGTTPHYESFSRNSELTWTPLTPGTYNISEKDASEAGYTWTVTGTDAVIVNLGETTEATVTNSYYKNTEYTPSITKALKFGDEDITWPDGISFDFYLSFISGTHGTEQLTKSDVILNNREATATETNKTAQFELNVKDPDTQEVVDTLPGIEFKKPGTYTFTIEEVEPAGAQDHKKNGIKYSVEKVYLTVVVEEVSSGVLEVKSHEYTIPDLAYSIQDSADGADAGLITNSPDYPTYAPSVTKKLTKDGQIVPATEWDEKKSFTFDLAFSSGEAGNVIMPSNLEKTVTASSDNLKETFNEIAFKEEGDYTFTVTEQQGDDPTVNYNTEPKTITVTVGTDDYGNLNVTQVAIDNNTITGEAIVGSGVTIENTIVEKKPFEFTKIWKNAGGDNVVWPEDGDKENVIKITLYQRLADTSASDRKDREIAQFDLDSNGGKTGDYSWTATKNVDNKYYTFKIEGLSVADDQGNALEYYVQEAPVDGYKNPEYGWSQTTESNGEEITTVVGKTTENDRAKDKEYVINRPNDAVTLPSTGGPGTKMFYSMGIAFIAMAGLLFFIKKKSIRSIADFSERRW